MFKVAIVDDEIWVCRLIQKLINWEELGLELAFVENDGESALELIIDERPDIVISDVRMPSMDGMEMLESMRKKKIKSRFIIISGYPDFDYAQKAIKHGAFAYLLKPVEKEKLNDTLLKVVSDLKKETEQKAKIYHQNENIKKIKDVTSELFIRKLVAKRRIEESILKLAVSSKLMSGQNNKNHVVVVVKAVLDGSDNMGGLNFIEKYSSLYSDLNKKSGIITFYIDNLRVFILNFGEDVVEQIDDYIKQEYAELKYNQGRNIVISYSDIFQDINETGTQFDNAIRGSCQYMTANSEKKIYPYSSKFDLVSGLIPRELKKLLTINVEALSVENMLEIVHDMYDVINDIAKEKPHIIQDMLIHLI